MSDASGGTTYPETGGAGMIEIRPGIVGEITGPGDPQYLGSVIMAAARALRAGERPEMVATDLEDSLSWSRDPAICGHPFARVSEDGQTYCRTCPTNLSDDEGMGL